MGGVRPPSGLHGDRIVGSRQDGPLVPRMLLGTRLRQLREARRISREAAGEEIRASHSKISRLELGRTGFKLRDVADLLTLYGVTDEAERETLLALAAQANAPAWWSAYADVVPHWFQAYLGVEYAADIIRTFEVQFIPGLLQTEDYARAVIRLGHGDAAQLEIDRRVELRMRRQYVLRRSDPVRLWAVIDEAALRRAMAGPATMRRQLRHLARMCELPNVTILVMPFDSGGHAAAGGAFTIVRLPAPELPDIVYLEQLTSALYVDKPDEVEQYWHVMNTLGVEAKPPGATPAILHRIMKEL